MAKRPRIEGGTTLLPRTRTSSVPFDHKKSSSAAIRCISGYATSAQGKVLIPSLASSKQWEGSQCDVNIVTVCPRFCRPTAASITRRSAPPMPRSGWKKTTLRGPEAKAMAAMRKVGSFCAGKARHQLGSGSDVGCLQALSRHAWGAVAQGIGAWLSRLHMDLRRITCLAIISLPSKPPRRDNPAFLKVPYLWMKRR
jgi:hypothetical protein